MANRLEYEDSPYLQQHKNNPLDWYPWCDEAFERAQKEHKPIFISIGYSSCHWCHVMEHDVFENEEIATFMNAHFISIKVDREERPDIDKYYQELYQLLNRKAGGWPMSVFCTPDNKPIYSGTYIPPKSQNNQLGFSELTKIIAQKVEANDEEVFKNAAEIEHYLKPQSKAVQATQLQEHLAKTFVKQASQNYENRFGGFSVSPKFPHTSTLKALLSVYQIFHDDKAKEMLTHTLKEMARGGMYDLVDGGFCRYSTDEQWLVPHFEKMTYDNALLIQIYAKTALAFNDADFEHIAQETLHFMRSFMMEDALFYSASDADTEGEEGKYFVYDYEESKACLLEHGIEDVASKLETLCITPEGNFEGHSIVRIEADERPQWFESVRLLLAQMRQKRLYPFIDKKVITAWNAMMVSALFALAKMNQSYTHQAFKTLDTLLEKLYLNKTLYHSMLISSEPKIKAFLEDYAYLGVALIDAYESDFDEKYLELAKKLADDALEQFYDSGRWFFSKDEFVTEADPSDSSYPGSVGVMLDLLQSLMIHGYDSYSEAAQKTLDFYSLKLSKQPLYFPYLFDQALRSIKGSRVIKAKKEALETLPPLAYPYVHRHEADETGYLICGEQSCFANTADPKEVNDLLQKTF